MRKSIIYSLMLCFIFSFFFSPFTKAYAKEKDIVITYTFETSKDKNFKNYKVKETIKKDGEKYKLKDVKYKTKLAKDSISKEITKDSNDFEDSIIENDKTLYKNGEAKENIISYTYAIKGVIVNSLPATIKFTEDEKDYIGKLKSVNTNKYRVPFTVEAKFTNIGNAKEVNILGNKYLVDTVKPAFKGYESILRKYLNLDSSYLFTGSKWTSNNGNDRAAIYTGTREVSDFIGNYEAYTYTQKYSNNKNVVEAIATYEANSGLSLFSKILIGSAIGIAVIASTIAVILFILRKRRNE